MKLTKDTRFLIVGLGLMGAAYARALRKAGHTVFGLDTDLETRSYALQHQIVDELVEEVFPKVDVVILALYPNAMFEWLKIHQDQLYPNTLISDVSGVKQGLVEPIQALLRDDLEFISAHPMAGKERSGIENSEALNFTQANYIVTPTEKNSQEALRFALDLGILLGFKKVSQLSLKEHDDMIAFLSQLTHVIAVSLMNTSDNTHLKDYTGDSFRDLTRIAKINEDLWTELFLHNKMALIDNIDAFMNQLTIFKQSLLNEDAEAMKKLMRQSTQRRENFDE